MWGLRGFEEDATITVSFDCNVTPPGFAVREIALLTVDDKMSRGIQLIPASRISSMSESSPLPRNSLMLLIEEEVACSNVTFLQGFCCLSLSHFVPLTSSTAVVKLQET